MGVERLYNSVEFESQWQLRPVEGSRIGDGDWRGVVGKATPGRRGPLEPWLNWGPEKMLKRCIKESHHPAEWIPGLRLSTRRTRKTQCWRPSVWGSKYYKILQNITTPSHTQTLSNPFRTLAIKWEVKILLKKSSCVCCSLRRYVSSIYMYILAWTCIWEYNISGTNLFCFSCKVFD